jgi:hypothetical protein
MNRLTLLANPVSDPVTAAGVPITTPQPCGLTPSGKWPFVSPTAEVARTAVSETAAIKAIRNTFIESLPLSM